ncbi:hypothetical protein BDY21DRAFT_263478, partial [Lineolata rhizophorae]
LNAHLATRTTLLGAKPSAADVAAWAAVSPVVRGWDAEARTGELGLHHVVRFVAWVQETGVFGLRGVLGEGEKVGVDRDEVVVRVKQVDVKAEKERKKKEKEGAEGAGGIKEKVGEAKEAVEGKAAAAVAKVKGKGKGKAEGEDAAAAGTTAAAAPQEGKKKEKKEKAPKPAKAPPKETPLSPHLIDLRVGHILKCELHPNADSLFVSTMAVGDPPGTDNTSEYDGHVVRTVCSGLNGLVPLNEMQGRKVVAVCNLKPVTMRGVKSCAMVLAASPRDDAEHKGPVELVKPPPGAKAGDRVCFEGWEGEPEGMLNPKKKVWETLQPGFTTTEGREVAFDAGAVEALVGAEHVGGREGNRVLKAGGEACTVETLVGATVR